MKFIYRYPIRALEGGQRFNIFVKATTLVAILFDKAKIALLATIVTSLTMLHACSVTTVYQSHKMLHSVDDGIPVASVYFIRPMPLKPKGIADDALTVKFQGEDLIKIDEGYYTLVKMLPSTGTLSTHSRTRFTNHRIIDVSRQREYKFIAGKTYFIHIKQINEEFRGVFYDPAPVDLPTAKKLIAENVSPKGRAKLEPISALQHVPDIPAPSALEPAFPEGLYPGQKYLIKGNPVYKAKPKTPDTDKRKNEITFDKKNK